jgi:hypothetical protein
MNIWPLIDLAALAIVMCWLMKHIVIRGFGIDRRHDRTMRSYLRRPRNRWSRGDSELLSDLGIDPHRVADDAVRRGAS